MAIVPSRLMAVVVVAALVACSNELDTTKFVVVLDDRVVFNEASYTDVDSLRDAIQTAQLGQNPIPATTLCSSPEMIRIAVAATMRNSGTGLASIMDTKSDSECKKWKAGYE